MANGLSEGSGVAYLILPEVSLRREWSLFPLHTLTTVLYDPRKVTPTGNFSLTEVQGPWGPESSWKAKALMASVSFKEVGAGQCVLVG